MLLTSDEIEARGIVGNSVPLGKRSTSYDATVGTIITNGKIVAGDRFKLPPRGIVWVVSRETFTLPNDITGIATLRTRWTHKGVLTLNVGIIDPGWSGPLAAAIVNFSNYDFLVKKGDSFLRAVFDRHAPTNASSISNSTDTYLDMVVERSVLTTDSFMNISAVSEEVATKLFGAPRWISRLTIAAILVAVFAILFPIAYGVNSDYIAHKNEVSSLKAEVAEIRKTQDELRVSLAILTRSLHP